MIIAVWGFTGSGKNTLGKLLAEKLGYRMVCPTFKDLAKEQGIPLMELQKRAEKDHSIDRKFDELLKKEIAGGDCVVTTWLGPWMADADVRIKLVVSEKTRAERVAGREGISVKEALKHVRERDGNNIKRYKAVYGIDITDEEIFDAILDGERSTPEELLKAALRVIEKKKGKG
ncbi:cytidylate kinase family protein [Candidatus Micrarchaeota archaeon]|nr:cytidylate kinase family protein [Candidatus Micrarchaeota archaeon]